MRMLIIEDEAAAARRLEQLLKEVVPEARILAVLESVKDSITWLQTHDLPDLIISDIQLADGTAFEIFSLLTISVPVIFTTAYDAYALKAFKLNSIDYLLKPVIKEELHQALEKYRKLSMSKYDVLINEKILNVLRPGQEYKSRFLIRQGERYISIPVGEVLYLRAEDKILFLYTAGGKRYIADESMEELEKLLDPSKFFRLNRQYLAPIYAIEKIQSHFNGRLKITLPGCDDNDIFVSREKATAFKNWLNR